MRRHLSRVLIVGIGLTCLAGANSRADVSCSATGPTILRVDKDRTCTNSLECTGGSNDGTYCVDDTPCTGGGTCNICGLTWSTAFTYLQDALKHIGDIGGGDYEIWVADGTYYPDLGSDQSNNDRASTFRMIDDVNIYGGFNGSESNCASRSVRRCNGGDYAGLPCVDSADCPNGACSTGNSPTILSGDLDGDDETSCSSPQDCESNGGVCVDDWCLNGDNAYHVVTYDLFDSCSGGSNAGNPCLSDNDCPSSTCDPINVSIDGFVIQSGMADGTGVNQNQGAAIEIRKSSKICYGGTAGLGTSCTDHEDCGTDSSDCTVKLCWTGTDHLSTCEDADDCASSTACSGVTASGNPRQDRVCDSGYKVSKECHVTGDCTGQCRPESCLPGGPVVKNCLVRHNHATDHAAVNDHGSGSVFDNCVFRGNTAAKGGALLVDNGSPTITNCLFERNATSAFPHEGGAVWLQGRPEVYGCPSTAAPIIQSCVFVGNEAKDFGGALFSNDTSVTIQDCSFIQNTTTVNGSGATGGGALWLQSVPAGDAAATISRCRFVNNETKYWAQLGGAIYSWGAGVLVEASEFLGNSTGGTGGGAIFTNDATVLNCLFIGNKAVQVGGTNFLEKGGAITSYLAGDVDVLNCTGHSNYGEDGSHFTFAINGGIFSRYMNNLSDGIGPTSGEAVHVCNPVDCDNDGASDQGLAFRDPPCTTSDGKCPSGGGPHNCDFYGDLHLAYAGSAGIDEGDNCALYVDGTVYSADLDGNTRRVDDTGTTDTGSTCSSPSIGTPIVDFGAYEWNGATCSEHSDCCIDQVCCDSECVNAECCDSSDCGGNTCCDGSCCANTNVCCNGACCAFANQICCAETNSCRACGLCATCP